MSHVCNCEYCDYVDQDEAPGSKGIQAMVDGFGDPALSAMWVLRSVVKPSQRQEVNKHIRDRLMEVKAKKVNAALYRYDK